MLIRGGENHQADGTSSRIVKLETSSRSFCQKVMKYESFSVCFEEFLNLMSYLYQLLALS